MLYYVFATTTLLTIIFCLVLGSYNLYRNPKSKIVRIWFVKCIAVSVWSIGLLGVVISKTDQQALISNYILYTGTSFIPILFYHVVIELLRLNTKKRLLILGYILALFFLILTYIPNQMIGGVEGSAGFEYWLQPGQAYYLFVLYFVFYVVWSFYLLCRGFNRSDGIINRQIFYLILASIIGFGGGMTNFLPQLVGIYPFGSFVVFLYPIIITYGIFLKKY